MAARRPLVIVAGRPQQIPSGDSAECEGVLLKGAVDAFLRSNSGTIEARNAANSALAPLQGSSLTAVGAGGGSLSFTPNFGGGANSVMELRASTGLVFQDWSANTTDDYNARLILNSTTQFRFQGAVGLQYYFDAPLNAVSLVLTTPLAIASGGTGGNTALAARSGLGTLASANSAKSSAYTIVTGDVGRVIECDATSAAFTVTLPAASTAAGMVFTIRKTDTTVNTVAIACNGSDTILGASSFTLWDAGDVITLSSTGAGTWVLLSATLRAATGNAAFLPLGQPEGLTLSRNSGSPNSSIDIAIGRVLITGASGLRYRAQSGSVVTRSLTSLYGSGNGGRFSGTVSANQWWHVFAMRNDTTGLMDFGFDTSATGANKPSGWSVRAIGSIKTDGSSNIIDFVQVDDTFYWKTEIQDFRAAINTTASLITLSVPPITGVEAIARIASGLPNANIVAAILASSPLVDDQAPASQGGGSASVEARYVTGDTAAHQSAMERIPTNTGQIRVRAAFTGSGSAGFAVNPRVATIGFVHPRGAY